MTLPATAPDRCLDALEALADAAPLGLPLTAFADRLGMPKSAAHRLLQVLTARGFALQDPATQRYRATLRLATLGFRVLEAQGSADACQPALDRMADAAGCFARMAVVEGDGIAYVARAQGARGSLRYEPVMGRPVRLHATATGKIWLAGMPEARAAALVEAQGFAAGPLGPCAIRALPPLLEELSRARARGWSSVEEEGEAGVSAMAAAVRPSGPAGPVAGVVSLAAPSFWLTAERMEALATLLLGTADELAALWPARARQASLRAPSAA